MGTIDLSVSQRPLRSVATVCPVADGHHPHRRTQMSTITLPAPTTHVAGGPAAAHVTRDVAARAVDARKTYGRGESEVHALDGVDASFYTGEFTAIMGPSGSGKSTLMHAVAGLDTLTSGDVYIGDVNLGQLKRQAADPLARDHIGFIFQAFNLVPTLTALENITLPSMLAGRKADQQWLELVIETVGLGRQPGQAQAVRAVVWPAAARRCCPRAGQPAEDHLRRRAHRQPGLTHRHEILAFMRQAVRQLGQTS